MTDPTRKRQLEELDQVKLCTRILYQARSELYLNMRFLDVSLSSLGFEADWGRGGIATDGWLIYYGPEYLTALFGQGRNRVNRAYLHMLFHCLFCHMYTRKVFRHHNKRNPPVWSWHLLSSRKPRAASPQNR